MTRRTVPREVLAGEDGAVIAIANAAEKAGNADGACQHCDG